MKGIFTQNKNRTKNLVYLLILLVIVVINTIIQSPGGGFLWVSPVTSHRSSIPEIWSLSGIYMNREMQPLMTTIDNKLIIIGSDNINQKSSIMAFDGNSGNMIWRTNSDAMSIASTFSAIIVGGPGQVLALNDESGKTVWRTIVSANVTRIIPKEDRLYIYGTSGGNTYVLDANSGNILETSDGISTIEQEPTLGNIAYSYNGNGDVLAIDKSNNQELWKSEANVLGNLAVTPSFVYALSQDGDLLRFNSQTGAKESFVTFSSPFIPRSEQTPVFPFYVVTDEHANIVFVYLGDSAQLFAFQLPVSP